MCHACSFSTYSEWLHKSGPRDTKTTPVAILDMSVACIASYAATVEPPIKDTI